MPAPNASALGWAAIGGVAQIAATALMLSAMRSRGFGVVTALMKTEPVSLALLAAIAMAEPLGAARLGAILAALDERAGGAEIVPLAGRAGRPAERVLVRARKGSRAALVLYPPFTLHAGDAHDRDGDSYSPAAQGVLRGMEALGTRV